VKDSLTNFNPKLFLTVHSGALSMFTSYAYEKRTGTLNMPNMVDILGHLNQKYC